MANPLQYISFGQQPLAQEPKATKNQIAMYKSLPRDTDRLFLNPADDYLNQQFESEYQKQQKNIKNIYGGVAS